MSDGSWKLDRLMDQVYRLEQENKKMVPQLVELRLGLKLGDAVFWWDADTKTGGSGIISIIEIDHCFVKIEGKHVSRQFGYESVSKMTGGDTNE